ncbi:hypothetical protein [Endozoicomonas ascidiicola]|uniref:hypothetical protein n=1 Tax=Endozoicomonas ascidiicola TaxID=1698521 RepID=UPI00083566CE|nr:hypothetical protein [Endozoicomonas ascidiicola]
MLEVVQSGLMSDRNVTGLNVTSSSSGNSMLSPSGQSGKPDNSMLTPLLPNDEQAVDADVKTVSSTVSTTVTTTTEKTGSIAKGVGRDVSPPKLEDQNDLAQAKKNSSKVVEADNMKNVDKPAGEHEDMMQGG